ncbi:MAG: hypothetical protein JO096_01980, partial [Alphaproteobacteria bacterium]|nr:hypothetical protein [Alphaproteobacteria bacterium]
MMEFLSDIAKTTARDPLVMVIGPIVLGGLVDYFLFRRHSLIRAAVRVIV